MIRRRHDSLASRIVVRSMSQTLAVPSREFPPRRQWFICISWFMYSTVINVWLPFTGLVPFISPSVVVNIRQLNFMTQWESESTTTQLDVSEITNEGDTKHSELQSKLLSVHYFIRWTRFSSLNLIWNAASLFILSSLFFSSIDELTTIEDNTRKLKNFFPCIRCSHRKFRNGQRMEWMERRESIKSANWIHIARRFSAYGHVSLGQQKDRRRKSIRSQSHWEEDFGAMWEKFRRYGELRPGFHGS